MKASYRNFVENQLQPWLRDFVKDGYFRTEDNIKIHYYMALHPNEKASIVMIHGFSEFFGKHHENAYRFYQAGYSVFFIELRGHGKSDRTNRYQDSRVHVNSFDEYVLDVRAFMEKIVRPSSQTKNYFLYAHSMGGAVACLYLEKYPNDFTCAVLSSPMLKMNYGKVPNIVIGLLMLFAKIAPVNERFGPGQKPFDARDDFENSSQMDRDRYDYQMTLRKQNPFYQTWSGTWGWLRAGKEATDTIQRNQDKIHTPILLLQAGNDSMVCTDEQDEFARKNPNVKLITYADSKHEIFNATKTIRTKYYNDIFTFFKANEPN